MSGPVEAAREASRTSRVLLAALVSRDEALFDTMLAETVAAASSPAAVRTALYASTTLAETVVRAALAASDLERWSRLTEAQRLAEVRAVVATVGGIIENHWAGEP